MDPLTQQTDRAKGSVIFIAWWLLALGWILWILGTKFLNLVSRFMVALAGLFNLDIR